MVARIGFFVLFVGGAWLAWKVTSRWFRAVSKAGPEYVKALRIERIMVQVLCVVMALVGLILLVG